MAAPRSATGEEPDMRDVNLWSFTGNLTKDPTLNTLTDGTPVCHFRVAVGGRRPAMEPSYVEVTAWRRDGERCSTYLRKGSRVFVAGPLHAALVTLPDGRTLLDLAVEARDIDFLGGPRPKKDPAESTGAASSVESASRAPTTSAPRAAIAMARR